MAVVRVDLVSVELYAGLGSASLLRFDLLNRDVTCACPWTRDL
jgi:hypothetical protein